MRDSHVNDVAAVRLCEFKRSPADVRRRELRRGRERREREDGSSAVAALVGDEPTGVHEGLSEAPREPVRVG